MGLSDIAASLATDVPWRTCAVCHHMAERGEEWAGQLRALLSNRNITFQDLAHHLAQDPDEPTIDRQALSRHARANCSAKESLR